MYNLMLKRQEFLRAQIEECLRIIDAAPPGKLEIHKNNSSVKWFIKADDCPRTYLPRSEVKKAELLAKKGITLSRLSILEKELRSTEMYLKHFPKDSEYSAHAEKASQFAELITPPNSLPWHLQPFNSNPAFPEKLKHSSASGHKLRSKSERLIDMSLFYRGVPFRYECELRLGGTLSYPDFTFFNERTGEYRYWEHFGMMDDPQYKRKAYDKTEFYISNGFIPGENVFFTYETSQSPLNITSVDRIIDYIADWLGL